MNNWQYSRRELRMEIEYIIRNWELGENCVEKIRGVRSICRQIFFRPIFFFKSKFNLPVRVWVDSTGRSFHKGYVIWPCISNFEKIIINLEMVDPAVQTHRVDQRSLHLDHWSPTTTWFVDRSCFFIKKQFVDPSSRQILDTNCNWPASWWVSITFRVKPVELVNPPVDHGPSVWVKLELWSGLIHPTTLLLS